MIPLAQTSYFLDNISGHSSDNDSTGCTDLSVGWKERAGKVP